MTFYGHFVAGEDQESIRPLIRHNKAFGVGFILDYGVEEDLSPEEAEKKEMESCTSEAERDGSGEFGNQCSPHLAHSLVAMEASGLRAYASLWARDKAGEYFLWLCVLSHTW